MSGKAFGWLVGLIVVASILVVAGISNGRYFQWLVWNWATSASCREIGDRIQSR